jgi:hypothetical protein
MSHPPSIKQLHQIIRNSIEEGVSKGNQIEAGTIAWLKLRIRPINSKNEGCRIILNLMLVDDPIILDLGIEQVKTWSKPKFPANADQITSCLYKIEASLWRLYNQDQGHGYLTCSLDKKQNKQFDVWILSTSSYYEKLSVLN